MKQKRSDQKPKLYLLPGKDAFDTDSVVELFKALTGRDPTPKELEEDRLEWEKENKPTSSGRPSVAWPPFEQKLATVLEKLEEDQFLILSVKHSNRFIQFAAQGSFGMRVETTGNSFLDKPEQLNEQQLTALIAAGWHDPTGNPSESTPENDPDGSPNFFVEFPTPVSFDAVARLTVLTLAEVLGVPHPGFLEYEAFDVTEGAIDLPELGLKLAKRVPDTKRLAEEITTVTKVKIVNYNDPKYWDNDVADFSMDEEELNDMYMIYFLNGKKPEDLVDPEGRKEYEAYLKKYPSGEWR